MFPIAPGFYDPIWFAQSSIPVYINWKGESVGDHIAGKNKSHAAAATACWRNLEAWNVLTCWNFFTWASRKRIQLQRRYLQFLNQASNASSNLGMKYKATAILYCREQSPQARQTITRLVFTNSNKLMTVTNTVLKFVNQILLYSLQILTNKWPC